MTEVCIVIDDDNYLYDHHHYGDDPALCSNSLTDLVDHLFGNAYYNPLFARAETWPDAADQNNAILRIRVDSCRYDPTEQPLTPIPTRGNPRIHSHED